MSVREKAEAAVKVLDVHMARAKERQSRAGREIGLMNLKNVEVEQLAPPVGEAVEEVGEAAKIVAKSLGIGHSTVSDAKVIIEKGTDEDKRRPNASFRPIHLYDPKRASAKAVRNPAHAIMQKQSLTAPVGRIQVDPSTVENLTCLHRTN